MFYNLICFKIRVNLFSRSAYSYLHELKMTQSNPMQSTIENGQLFTPEYALPASTVRAKNGHSIFHKKKKQNTDYT